MQIMQLNHNWVIIDAFHDTGREESSEDSDPSIVHTPSWFWTGRRWSSQSARSKLFATEQDAGAEMQRLRIANNS